jgi:hypothetical protein
MKEILEERNIQLYCHEDGRMPWLSRIFPIMVLATIKHEDVIEMVREKLQNQHDDPNTGCKGKTHNIQIYGLMASNMG